MTKKYLLDIDLDYDFLCYGISCHHKDYRLSWNINNVLNIKLAKQDAILIEDGLFKEDMVFSKYAYFDGKSGCAFTLINNRNKWGYLIPELQVIDFILMIRSDRINESVLIDKLRNLNIVLSITKVDPNSLKNKERLHL